LSTDPCKPLQLVVERIAAACARSDRDPSEVQLVAVTKAFSPERVREAMACGHTLFGENKVQEAMAKISEVGPGARWHLIGHLQRNKARHAVGLFELIHSVDGAKLVRELDRRAAALGLCQAVLVQVNLSREETKSGVLEADLWPLLDGIVPLEHLELRGLMTIPPPVEDAEHSRPWFSRLRALRDEAAHRTGLTLPDLSMGMTDDFEVAVEEGATLVRVGRAIFGERPYP
jgi:pyridoxal phosphate enzyme (YggS family)